MIAQWIRAALKHAGMSGAELARRMTERGLTVDRAAVNKMMKEAASEKTKPRKVKAAELLAISQITGYALPNSLTLDEHIESHHIGTEDHQVEPDFPPDPDELRAAKKQARRELGPGELIEVDVIAGLGNGGTAPPIMIDGKMVDNVRATWRVPTDFLRTELRSTEQDVEILPVDGDSMIPTLQPGDRVLVNRRQNTPSPDGLYAIGGPLGTQIKRLQYVQGTTDPIKILVISDNPQHPDAELTVDEIHVIGRVICRISRL